VAKRPARMATRKRPVKEIFQTDEETEEEEAEEEEDVKPPPKKRGRKAKDKTG